MTHDHSTGIPRMCAFFIILAAWLPGAPARAGIRPYDIRCDSMVNPPGVDSAPPRLSWKLQSMERGERQTAWQVLAASSMEALLADRGDVWDSGRREGDAQLSVPYGGRALASSERVFWKVRAWGRDGGASPWSAPGEWTMGVLSRDEWRAGWITDGELLRWVRGKLAYRSLPAADAAAPKWVGVDLGGPELIQTVRFSPVRQVIEEAQGFPVRFKVEIANDPGFKDAVVIADYTKRNFIYRNTHHKTTVPAFAAEGPDGEGVRGRYVRIISTQLKRDGAEYYLAFNQMEVVSGGRNIAAGARVIAGDSLEEGVWGKSALVDGLDVRGANPRENAALMARREFPVKRPLRRALAHISGLGHYELTVNGKKAGDHLLAPGWTAYEKTALYETHDITNLLLAGADNAVGVLLAGGFYNVRPGRYVKLETRFRPLTVICQIRLEYTDGSVDCIGTDGRWKVSHRGPVVFSNIYGGEDYDARREPAGWDCAGFDDRGWAPAVETGGPGGALRGVSYAAPPLKAHETLTPLRVTELQIGKTPLRMVELQPKVTVYDLGQNASLMPRIKVRGARGSVVKITPAELLNDDGSVSRASGGRGTGGVWWSYTLAGREEGEEWFPKFFYQGCRYLQVEAAAPVTGDPPPVVESLEGVVVHTSAPPAGEFACSNELFNRVRALVRWAQRSNLVSVITDCPHREKLGWLEQYHLNGPALRYEYDLSRLYTKTFGDMADAQAESGLVPDIAPEYVVFSDGFHDSPEWGSAIILAAWQQYEWTGDDTVFHRYYNEMRRYAGYLGGKAENGILPGGLGDWYDLGPKSPGRSQLTPIPLTATAVYYQDLKTLAAIAARLGKNDDAARLEREAAAVRKAYNEKFYNRGKGCYATDSQCANAMSLVFGLAEPGERGRVLDAIVRDVRRQGLTAGDVGYRYLLRALADGGRSDVIYEMNNQAARPGYGHQLAQGCTSLAETWDANPKLSQNHFMLGQITEWFYNDLAGLGIDPGRPGYKNVVIRPQTVKGVNWARASHESLRGPVASSWKRENGRLTVAADIPAGATGTIHVPLAAGVREVLDESTGLPVAAGRPGVLAARVENGSLVVSVESGRYVFSTASE
ncbi:MAG: glycoside hydrolase family 78 protein [Opitutaceae bacterium]|jgi:hypothetical protein|nr:glycoside hydrolase family 78 protein [Opitutaceae bacterium]